jgi:hypothetical protein
MEESRWCSVRAYELTSLSSSQLYILSEIVYTPFLRFVSSLDSSLDFDFCNTVRSARRLGV